MTEQKYNRDDKFEMVLALIKEPTQAELICKKYRIAQSTLYKWRARFLEGARNELAAYKTGPQPKEEYAAKSVLLSQKLTEYENRIAELACENEILKKNENWTSGPLL
jgi:transposase-like protein